MSEVKKGYFGDSESQTYLEIKKHFEAGLCDYRDNQAVKLITFGNSTRGYAQYLTCSTHHADVYEGTTNALRPNDNLRQSNYKHNQ